MILRLLKPERVNQREFGLCGPAHFVVLLLKSRPVKYVFIAMELLQAGTATGEDGSRIVANEYVRNFNPKGSMAQADWLLAGSLRNTDGPVPEGTARESYSGTKNPDVVNYCLAAGYKEVVSVMCYQRWTDSFASVFQSRFYADFHPPEMQHELDVLAEGAKLSDPAANFKVACALRSQGWRVLLQSNSGLFKFDPVPDDRRGRAEAGNKFDQTFVNDRDDTWKSITSETTMAGVISAQNFNHWVLAKDIAILGGDKVRLCVYTWGGQQTVKAQLTLAELANCYGGFVAARG
jgi:hypothetical protein